MLLIRSSEFSDPKRLLLIQSYLHLGLFRDGAKTRLPLIIDSEQMYHEVIREVCKKYGKNYTEELQSKLTGGTDRAVSEYVVKELKINESVERFERHLLEVSAERLPHAPLQKGVERLLKHLLLHQVPMALATNSTARQVQLHAQTKPEIFSVFRHSVTASDLDVGRAKPFPDLFLLAASKFVEQPAPERCLVFEDSIVGLRAGVAAGMQVVLTPHTGQLNPEDSKDATVVLDSLSEFKPELFGLPPFDDFPPKESSGHCNACILSYSKCCPPNNPQEHTKICHGCGCRKKMEPPTPQPPPIPREPTLENPPPQCMSPCYPPKPSRCVPPTLEPSSSICKPKNKKRPAWHSLVMFMLLCGITGATLERLW